jgi:hypothetical protein
LCLLACPPQAGRGRFRDGVARWIACVVGAAACGLSPPGRVTGASAKVAVLCDALRLSHHQRTQERPVTFAFDNAGHLKQQIWLPVKTCCTQSARSHGSNTGVIGDASSVIGKARRAVTVRSNNPLLPVRPFSLVISFPQLTLIRNRPCWSREISMIHTESTHHDATPGDGATCSANDCFPLRHQRLLPLVGDVPSPACLCAADATRCRAPGDGLWRRKL